MGSLPGKIIKLGCDHLLSILRTQPQIEYSRFYDGEDATRERLRERLGLSEEEAEWYCLELIMDVAVHQFETLGVVEVTELDDLLVDGEPDYQIELTELGRAFIDNGKPYEFSDVET